MTEDGREPSVGSPRADVDGVCASDLDAPVPKFGQPTTRGHAMVSALRKVRRTPSRVRFALLAVLAPPIAYLAYGIEPFYIQNGVDPFIYAGYAFEPSDLITRFGYTYYSVRFGLLLPAELLNSLFGASAGYLAFRWILATACVGAACVWSRRVGAPALAWISAPLLLVNPILSRALMTMYSDTVGVPYIFVAFVVLVLPGSRRSRLVSALVGGSLVALAVHANLFLAIPLGCALAAWAVTRIVYVRRGAVLEIVATVCGIALITSFGAVVYRIRYGRADIVSPSIDAARQLAGIVSTDRAPTGAWIDFRPFLFSPLLAVLALFAILVCRRSRPEWYETAAVAMLAAITAVYLYNEFITKGFFLQTYYYTSYFIGPTALITLMALRRLLMSGGARSLPALLVTAAVLVFPFIWTIGLRSVRVWTIPTVPLLAVLLLVLPLFQRRTFELVAAVVLATSVLLLTLANPTDVPLDAGQTYRREPHYETAFFNRDATTFERYQLASQLMELVPDWESSPGAVVFWYADADVAANLLGSTYLWRETTLTNTPPGLPDLEASTAVHLIQRTPRSLVLIGSSQADVERGAEAVRHAVAPLSQRERVLSSGASTIFVDLMEFQPSTCDFQVLGTATYWSALPTCA